MEDARRDWRWVRTSSRLSMMVRESREVRDPMEIRPFMRASVEVEVEVEVEVSSVLASVLVDM